jgi:hypothetical protein
VVGDHVRYRPTIERETGFASSRDRRRREPARTEKPEFAKRTEARSAELTRAERQRGERETGFEPATSTLAK